MKPPPYILLLDRAIHDFGDALGESLLAPENLDRTLNDRAGVEFAAHDPLVYNGRCLCQQPPLAARVTTGVVELDMQLSKDSRNGH